MAKVDKAFEGAEENTEVVETSVETPVETSVVETEHQEEHQEEKHEEPTEVAAQLGAIPEESYPEIGEAQYDDLGNGIKINDHIIYKTSTGERYVKVTGVADDNVTFIGDEGHEIVKRASDVEKAE